jgi:hypothetical protein
MLLYQHFMSDVRGVSNGHHPRRERRGTTPGGPPQHPPFVGWLGQVPWGRVSAFAVTRRMGLPVLARVFSDQSPSSAPQLSLNSAA